MAPSPGEKVPGLHFRQDPAPSCSRTLGASPGRTLKSVGTWPAGQTKQLSAPAGCHQATRQSLELPCTTTSFHLLPCMSSNISHVRKQVDGRSKCHRRKPAQLKSFWGWWVPWGHHWHWPTGVPKPAPMLKETTSKGTDTSADASTPSSKRGWKKNPREEEPFSSAVHRATDKEQSFLVNGYLGQIYRQTGRQIDGAWS